MIFRYCSPQKDNAQVRMDFVETPWGAIDKFGRANTTIYELTLVDDYLEVFKFSGIDRFKDIFFNDF